MKVKTTLIPLLKDKEECYCIALVSLLNKYSLTVIKATPYKGKKGIKSAEKYNVSGRDYVKISHVVKASYNTVKKYVDLCISKGYIQDNNGTLIISSMRSKHNEHNFDICDGFLYEEDYTLKNVEKELRYALVANVIKKKQFIRRLLIERENVKNVEELKKINRKIRYYGIEKQYKDTGITLKKFAKETGMSEKTVIKYLKYGESCKGLKINRLRKIIYGPNTMRNLNDSISVENEYLNHIYTYGYMNNGITVCVRVFANTYAIPDEKISYPVNNYSLNEFRTQVYC